MTDVEEAPPQADDGSESEEELIISAATLLNLGDAPPEEETEQEGGEGGGGEGGEESEEGQKTLGVSASVPVLGSPEAGREERRTVMFSSDTADTEAPKAEIKSKRHERRSVGKRSLTLGGRQKNEKLPTDAMIAHLNRNFSNILMLVSRSLDALSDVFTKNKGKGTEAKAIKLGQQLTFHLAEVNIIITKVTNMCDGKTKVSTGSLVPDSVEEALATSKHTLSVLLPKFNKMIKATKEEGAVEKIQEGLLDGIDEALSDAAEQMDNLGNWLKESGLASAAGAVMLAMRWKKKAFGKGRSNHFGSIRVAPGGSPIGTVGRLSAGGSTGANAQVANALADAKKEAMADMADILGGEGGGGGITEEGEGGGGEGGTEGAPTSEPVA
ncbi:hypothetical protein TrST_g14099 [Triparma strigata]|uniref:Uncharacterized protein n=1 Tax=Triparma strigata TaxID=1606541 RepID=A0A9W7E6P9_9STRA|nr:hypothetical protein TrST_g14099 [Triparma strigata]